MNLVAYSKIRLILALTAVVAVLALALIVLNPTVLTGMATTFDVGQLITADGQTIGAKVVDDSAFETHFAFRGIVGDELVVRFYHDGAIEQPVWIEQIEPISYTLSTEVAQPNAEVTLRVSLDGGRVPRFKLHVGAASEIFAFGGSVGTLEIQVQESAPPATGILTPVAGAYTAFGDGFSSTAGTFTDTQTNNQVYFAALRNNGGGAQLDLHAYLNLTYNMTSLLHAIPINIINLTFQLEHCYNDDVVGGFTCGGSAPGGTIQNPLAIAIFNWTSNAFQNIGNYTGSPVNESNVTITVTSGFSDFISTTNLTVIRYVVNVTIIANGNDAAFGADFAQLTVNYLNRTPVNAPTTIATPGYYIFAQNVSSAGIGMNITASNVTLDCAGYGITYGTGGGTNAWGVNVTGAVGAALSNVTIKNCNIRKNVTSSGENYGIRLYNVTGGRIQNITIRTNGTAYNRGILLEYSSNSTLTANNISTNGTDSSNYGIYLISSSNSTITSNTIYTNGTNDNYGIYVYSSANYNNLASNDISTNGTYNNYGIYIYASSDYSTLSNNTIRTSGTSYNYGIYISSSANSTLASNNISTNGTSYSNHGISFSSSFNSTLKNNTIRTSGTHSNCGISLYSNSNNNTLSSNTISTSGTYNNYGIYFYGSSNYNSLTFNNVTTTTATSHGIFVEGSSHNRFVVNQLNVTHQTSQEWNSTFGSGGIPLNNTAVNLALVRSGITVSLEDYNGTAMKGLLPAEVGYTNPSGQSNIGKYVNATNNSANSWLYLNVSYADSDWQGSGIANESTLRIRKYNTSAGAWTNTSFYNQYNVDTASNVVYANITNFASTFGVFGQVPVTFSSNVTSNTTLTGNLTGSGTALTIGADNIVLDLGGYTLTGDGTGYGVNLAGYDNVTIQNGVLKNFNIGLRISGASGFVSNNVTIDPAIGLLIEDTSNSRFENSTIGNCTQYGVLVNGTSTNNTIRNMTLVNDTVGVKFDGAGVSGNVLQNSQISNNTNYGIYLDASSNNNIIDSTAQSNTWDFQSTSSSQNNTVTNLTTWQNVVSFASLDIALKGLNTTQPPANPNGYSNISKYVNATNNSATSWLYLNFSYADGDVANLTENTLGIWKYNSTAGAWSSSGFYSVGGVDTANNIAYANITNFASTFGVFGQAPPVTELNISSCTNLNQAGVTYYLNQSVSSAGTCMNVTADNVTLDCRGYTIDGDNASVDYGVYNLGRGNATIRNCNIKEFYNGIFFSTTADYGTITNNTLIYNTFGIYVYQTSRFNNITFNTANNNSDTGILLATNCRNNTVAHNSAGSNAQYGIRVFSNSNNNTILNNTVTGPSQQYGVYLTSSYYNNLTHNNATLNDYGIYLDLSSNNALASNTANSNGYGIQLASSDNNTLSNNTASLSSNSGIHIQAGSKNTLVNNIANSNNDTGIRLSAGSNNNLTNSTAQNNTQWDFYSSGTSANNTVINLTSWQNAVSFTSLDVGLKGLQSTEIPSGLLGYNRTIGYGVNVTNSTPTSWLYLNFSYTHADLQAASVSESRLGIWKKNDSGWLSSGFNSSGGVDTATNVVWANITNFSSTFAPVGSPTAISECANLNATNEYYLLSQSVSATGTCMNVTASNVTLDCQGYNITYGTSTTGYGANVSAPAALTGITIKNCDIRKGGGGGAGNHGISLFNTSSSNVIGNNISTNGTNYNYGIYFSTRSNNNTLTSNNISIIGTDNNYGIGLWYSSNYNTLTNNIIRTNGTAGYNDGILLASSYNTLISNTVFTDGTGDANRGIWLSSSSNSTLTSNNISTSSTGGSNVGIFIDSSSNSTLTSNTISTNGTNYNYGIRLDSSSNSNLTNNNISTSGTNYNSGIILSSSSDSNTLTFNNISTIASTSHGLYIWGSSHNRFVGNRVDVTHATSYDWRTEFLFGLPTPTNNTAVNLTLVRNNVTVSLADFNGTSVKCLLPTEVTYANPSGQNNISKFVNATNNSANSWLYLNVSYLDSEWQSANITNDSTLRIWKFNSTAGAWTNESFYNQYGVDNETNIVYANITNFASTFGVFGKALDSTPPSIVITAPDSSSWQRATFNVTFNASDDIQLANCSFQIRNGSAGSWSANASVACTNATLANATVTVGAAANCTVQGTDECGVRVWAIDGVGNANYTERNFSIDYTVPTSTTTAPANRTWQRANFNLSIVDADTGGSGLNVSACYWRIVNNGVESWPVGGTIIPGKPGTWGTRTCNADVTVTVGPTGNCTTQGSLMCRIESFALDVAGNIGS